MAEHFNSGIAVDMDQLFFYTSALRGLFFMLHVQRITG